MIKLKINGLDTEYENLKIVDVLGDISKLTGTIHGCLYEPNMSVTVYDDEAKLFDGLLISYDTDGKTSNIKCYSNAWRLKGRVCKHEFVNTYIYAIFYGMRLELEGYEHQGNILDPSADSSIRVLWSDKDDSWGPWDDRMKVAMGGIINDVYVEEDFTISQDQSIDDFDPDTDYKQTFANWITQYVGYTDQVANANWQEILWLNMKDQYRNDAYPEPNDWLRVYDKATKLGEINSHVAFLAKEDLDSPVVYDVPDFEYPHHYFANGLLYKTGLILDHDIPQLLFHQGGMIIEEDNLLDAIKNVCRFRLAWIMGTPEPFRARFWLDGNTLYIRCVTEKVKHTLNYDEILDYNYETDMRELTNKITFITDFTVDTKEDVESIEKYGEYNVVDEISLMPYEGLEHANTRLIARSSPTEVLTLSTFKKWIDVGDNIQVELERGILETKLVQEVERSIVGNTIKTTLKLSERSINKDWKVYAENAEDWQDLLSEHTSGNRRMLMEKHTGYDIFKIKKGKGVIFGFDKFLYETGTGGTDGHIHYIQVPYSTIINFR